MRKSNRAILILFVAFLVCGAARSQTPAPPVPFPTPFPVDEKPCHLPLNLDVLIMCPKYQYQKFIGRDGWHFVVGSVAPGGGLAGGGGYRAKKIGPNWVTDFESSARASLNKYWELDSNLRLTKTRKSNTADPNLADLKINIYGLIKDMHRVDFFGIGPETSVDDRAVFHYREGVAGADISQPVNTRFDVGGAVEGIWPKIVRITDPTVTTVQLKYSEATAPGLTSQPAFLHFVAFAGVHSKSQIELRKFDYLFLCHAYQDVGEHAFSFRRFNADLRNKIPLGKDYQLRIRGRLSLAETSEGQRMPFYLMDTLGGSNIRGDDTLRGFRDYRFYDRNYFLVQTEFMRHLYSFLDVIAFYDVGKVAASASSLGEGRLRHTYGFGIVGKPRQLDNILFRFYISLGSGEGSRTYLGGGLTGRGDRLTR